MVTEDCQHDYVPDKMGEMCSKCGDRPNPPLPTTNFCPASKPANQPHQWDPDDPTYCVKCRGRYDRPSFSPRRREVVPESKELKRAEGRDTRDLSNTNSDTIVVPATLAMVQDVEVILGYELKALRLKAQKNVTMDGREATRMEKLVKMLAQVTELREKAEKGGQSELQGMSLTDIIKKLRG